MLGFALIFPVGEFDPDVLAAYLGGKRLEVVALEVEASAGFEVEVAAVPLARQDAVPDRPSRERVSHVWALVVGGMDAAVHVEEGDAP